MDIAVRFPETNVNAVHWVSEIVFGDTPRLYIEREDAQWRCYRLELQGKFLEMPLVFLGYDGRKTGDAVHEPKLPLSVWRISTSELSIEADDCNVPVLFGKPGFQLDQSGNGYLNVDIYGSIFFLVSRYEEIVAREKDEHDRFPATASFANKCGILDRPIADEYVEILWAAMKRVWPGLERKSRQGQVRVTCDVDQPFDCRIRNFRRWLGRMGGDILVRRDFRMAFDRLRNRFAVRRGDFRFDPYYTFDWYLDACEQAGRRAAFYFIPGHSSTEYDSCYDLDEPLIVDLIRYVAHRGHEVGVHGSYNTFRDPVRVNRERQRMIETCQRAGVDDGVFGNRQHYLRWDTRETPDHLDAAGYEYDTSGGFADRPGFRYGTARPFPMWSWRVNAPLSITQRPLVLMECSVFGDPYMGVGTTQQAMDLMLTLKRRALNYRGDFTMLWHNSRLTTAEDRAFFLELIA